MEGVAALREALPNVTIVLDDLVAGQGLKIVAQLSFKASWGRACATLALNPFEGDVGFINVTVLYYALVISSVAFS